MQVYGVTSFYVKYESFERNLLCLLQNNITHGVCVWNSINKGKAKRRRRVERKKINMKSKLIILWVSIDTFVRPSTDCTYNAHPHTKSTCYTIVETNVLFVNGCPEWSKAENSFCLFHSVRLSAVFCMLMSMLIVFVCCILTINMLLLTTFITL